MDEEPRLAQPGVRYSSPQGSKSHRRYAKQIEPGALAEYICRQCAADGYETQAIDTAPNEAMAQVARRGKMRAFLGLRESLTVRIHVIETGTFVEIGKAAWVDKLVGLAGGWIITIVPFFTSPFGMYNQHKLRKKVLALIEHFLS